MSWLLVMCSVMVCFSCQSDEAFYNRVVEGTWKAELGFFNKDAGATKVGPLESRIHLNKDGSGYDEQRFSGSSQVVRRLKFQWNITQKVLFLNYGSAADSREIRQAYVSNGTLNGKLFIDGKFIRDILLRKTN